VINVKKMQITKSPPKKNEKEKEKVDNEPLNLGPPDIESDEEDNLQKILLDQHTPNEAFLV